MFKQNLIQLFFDYLVWEKKEFRRFVNEGPIKNLQKQLSFERYLTHELNYTEEESKLIIHGFKNIYDKGKDKNRK